MLIDLKDWSAASGRVYLNTGHAGPSPDSVIRRIKETLEQEVLLGPASPEALDFAKRIDMEAKCALAALLSADPAELRLTHGTREGINIVLFGFNWQAGDQLIISDLEHSALKQPAEVLAERHGVQSVELSIAQSSSPQDILKTFQSVIGTNTRLIAFSHVQYGCGLRMPAKEIVQAAHDRGIPVLIDAAQSVGQMPVDVGELGCDFLAVSGQKWLMGPIGTGALYIRGQARNHLNPLFTTNSLEAKRIRRRAPLDRFGLVSQNPGLVAGLTAAVGHISQIGVARILARITELANLLRESLELIPATLLSPTDPALSSGLITINLPGWSPENLTDVLAKRFLIIGRTVKQPAGLRLCTSHFNTEDEIRYVAESLNSLCQTSLH